MATNIDEISKSAIEINEILKYAPLKYRLKLRSKYRNFLNVASSISSYTWKYDIHKKLYEQDISPLTREMLKIINNDIRNKKLWNSKEKKD